MGQFHRLIATNLVLNRARPQRAHALMQGRATMNTEKVEVTFQDGSTCTFDKGVPMRQIWHEDVD